MKHSLLHRLVRHTALLAAGLGFAALAQAQYSNLFVFGDSLSDVGNDLIITSNGVPSTAYYTNGTDVGRFTNGLTYADYLAQGLGLNLTPSLVNGGNNYAYGGARTNSVNPSLPPMAQSFNQQIGTFLGTHAQADASALYVLWIGANDLSDAVTATVLGNPTAVSTAISSSMQSIGGAIQALSSRGATHFLIPNLPDLALIPAVTQRNSAGLSFLAHSASVSFNDALAATLASFTALDIHSFDAYTAQHQVTANPAAFGFTNVTSACYTGEVDGGPLVPGGPAPSVCSSPASYLYWDYEHPTQALHAVLGAQMLAAVVPEPAQWVALAFGLLALAAVQRTRRRG